MNVVPHVLAQSPYKPINTNKWDLTCTVSSMISVFEHTCKTSLTLPSFCMEASSHTGVTQKASTPRPHVCSQAGRLSKEDVPETTTKGPR